MSRPEPGHSEPRHPELGQGRTDARLGRGLRLSLLIVELGVLSALVFSLVLYLAAVAQAGRVIVETLPRLAEAGIAKELLLAAVEQADLLLVATALLIIGLGLQGLFVGYVAQVPRWLRIRTFDDLKQKLLGVAAVALVVQFLSVALTHAGQGPSILYLGGATALVVLAAGYFSRVLGDEQAGAEDLPERPGDA